MNEYKCIPTQEALRQELVVCPYGERCSRKTLIRGSALRTPHCAQSDASELTLSVALDAQQCLAD
jgi:hypothetical protein